MLRLHHCEEQRRISEHAGRHCTSNPAQRGFCSQTPSARLRGQHALEHSYFVSPETRCVEEAPAGSSTAHAAAWRHVADDPVVQAARLHFHSVQASRLHHGAIAMPVPPLLNLGRTLVTGAQLIYPNTCWTCAQPMSSELGPVYLTCQPALTADPFHVSALFEHGRAALAIENGARNAVNNRLRSTAPFASGRTMACCATRFCGSSNGRARIWRKSCASFGPSDCVTSSRRFRRPRSSRFRCTGVAAGCADTTRAALSRVAWRMNLACRVGRERCAEFGRRRSKRCNRPRRRGEKM